MKSRAIATKANAGESERPGMELQQKRIGFLMRQEFSRKLLSYAATAVFVAFFGLVAVPIFSSAMVPLAESARSVGRFVDLFFLAIISTLSVNALSRDYFLLHRDPFSGWLVFLRSLPVSPKEIILARSLVMLPATVVMTALFFAPVAIFSLALDLRLDAAQCFWFALLWLGYALFTGGVNLYIELGTRGKTALAVQLVWLAVLIAAAWLLDGDLVFTTFELAGSYGPLAAGVALLAGGSLFALFAKATERRVRRRELSS